MLQCSSNFINPQLNSIPGQFEIFVVFTIDAQQKKRKMEQLILFELTTLTVVFYHLTTWAEKEISGGEWAIHWGFCTQGNLREELACIIMLGGGRQRRLLCECDTLFMKQMTTEGCVCWLCVQEAGRWICQYSRSKRRRCPNGHRSDLPSTSFQPQLPNDELSSTLRRSLNCRLEATSPQNWYKLTETVIEPVFNSAI